MSATAARLVMRAADVKVGDRLELPISRLTFPVSANRRYPDGSHGLFWRERPGRKWAEGESSGVFHKQPEERVAVHREAPGAPAAPPVPAVEAEPVPQPVREQVVAPAAPDPGVAPAARQSGPGEFPEGF